MNADNAREALRRRIRRFYTLLNRRNFVDCFHMIDPRVLGQPGGITFLHYIQSLNSFLEQAGAVTGVRIQITGLHLNEPTKLYEKRDFAIASTKWKDSNGNEHKLSERWVLEDDNWYTRSTGLVWTEPAESAKLPKSAALTRKKPMRPKKGTPSSLSV